MTVTLFLNDFRPAAVVVGPLSVVCSFVVLGSLVVLGSFGVGVGPAVVVVDPPFLSSSAEHMVAAMARVRTTRMRGKVFMLKDQS